MKRIVYFLFLLSSCFLFLSCGGQDYMPFKVVMEVFLEDVEGNPIPELKCSIIRKEDNEIMDEQKSDEKGYAAPFFRFDEVKEGRDYKEIYPEYYILVEDVDGEENGGEFLSKEIQPVWSHSDEEDYTFVMTLKN